jgi:hypothetical protein
MNPVLGKMKIADHDPVLILNAPEEFNEMLKEIPAVIHRDAKQKYGFLSLFTTGLSHLRDNAKAVIDVLEDDGYLWICYPKMTSRKYKSDLKRDRVMEVFGPYDFEGVTQIAIDNDWSAIRLRPVEKIKTLKRKKAHSAKGKARISARKIKASEEPKTDTLYEWL